MSAIPPYHGGSHGAALTPQEFVQKWYHARRNERAAAQEHFSDLCSLLRHPTPTSADPNGDWFAFEKTIKKDNGRHDFADVWKRGYFAWEYKGKGKDLGVAYQQLLRYREPLENPPLLVVCNIDHFQVHTNFTATAKRIHEFSNEDLLEAEPRGILLAVFNEPDRLRPDVSTAQVTEQAARRFAALANGLHNRGVPASQAAHFLTQLIFCLFAEDNGLLPHNALTNVVRRGVERPGSFRRNITHLFEAMRDGGEVNYQDIAHFNGGLFTQIAIVDLTPDELRTVEAATALDWASIETAIMGTLFERSLDPAQRTQLGAHYTGRQDIELIVEPVVLAPLRREWASVHEQCEKLRATTTGATPRVRRNQQAKMTQLLQSFKQRLAGVRVLDPAAGSGNFLAVSLTELLNLEKEAVNYGALAGLSRMFPDVSPRQMYGLKAYAVRLQAGTDQCLDYILAMDDG